MAYLRNTTVNLLNLHYGLHAAVMSGGGVFYLVVLLKAGVPAPAVLGAMALILAGRFCIRPLVLMFGKRTGLKPLVIFGAMATAAQYPFLAQVHGVDLSLLVLCLVAAVGDAFYWTSYHAYFASVGDEEHRGHQISAREALASMIGVIAPLVGAWMITELGSVIAFTIVATVQLASALPFLGMPNVPVAREARIELEAALTPLAMFAADGWLNAGYTFVWQVAMFLALGESFTGFGGAMAVAALVGAVAGLVLGRHIDLGGGRRAAWVAFAALCVTILLRAAAGSPALAVTAAAAGALAYCLYIPTMMTPVYNRAKQSACVLRFHFLAEGAWDLGGSVGCLAAAALLALGAPLSSVILLALLGAAASLLLLRRSYARL